MIKPGDKVTTKYGTGFARVVGTAMILVELDSGETLLLDQEEVWAVT